MTSDLYHLRELIGQLHRDLGLTGFGPCSILRREGDRRVSLDDHAPHIGDRLLTADREASLLDECERLFIRFEFCPGLLDQRSETDTKNGHA